MEGTTMAGKTVTATILTASGELITKTGVFNGGVFLGITGYNLYFCFDVESNRCVFDFFFGDDGESISIAAVKLELGSTQTLAHQDADGNWVLNDPPPDKGMELLKCIQSTADSADTYANKVIYHTGNKPTAADIGAPTVAEMNAAIASAGGHVVSASEPSDTKKLWINSSTGVLSYHNGSSWVGVKGVWG
jgi:hypothetical protein